MKNVITIFNREFRSYFSSPIAYVVIGLFLVLTGVFFYFADVLVPSVLGKPSVAGGENAPACASGECEPYDYPASFFKHQCHYALCGAHDHHEKFF